MIDVKKFMADHNLETKEVAKAMFPTNQYPKMAFKRIVDGEGLLDSDQLVRLAALARVSVAELFNGNWASKSNRKSFILEKGEYRAELEWSTWITRIFHRESMFHEKVLTQPTIPMSKYIEEIEGIISKHEFE